MRFIAPDDGNVDDRTVMAVTLPAAGRRRARPSRSTSRGPRRFRARSPAPGSIGNYFFLAQWFPKIGVLDNDGKWNCHQFHVAHRVLRRLRRLRRAHDGAAGLAGWRRPGASGSGADNADGTTTHRYYQEDVHDFAWTTSPDYVERRERFEHAGPAARRDAAAAAARARRRRPSAISRPRAPRCATTASGSARTRTATSPSSIPAWQSDADGMEYPTLFTAGTRWLIAARGHLTPKT